MKKIEYIGKINNWMDFRDMLVEDLKQCDTDVKLNKIIFAIVNSVFTNPERVNEDRKSLGLKPLTKQEINTLKNDN